MAEYSPITVARFWSKVNVRRSQEECWEWTGATKTLGYGRMKIDGKNYTASRIAWELANGEPLGERHALHQCDNPKCCNPNHITAGDHGRNMAEAWSRGRVTPRDLCGEKNPRAKLTQKDVDEIRGLLTQGLTNVSIAKRYGVTHSMISCIRRGKSWPEQNKHET